MSTPAPNLLNDGYCDVWNVYFIATMAASIVLIGFNSFIAYRRDKSVSPGKLDWGLPWGIGAFLFNIALWNLLPPNIFFLLFKVVWPDFNRLAPEMACLAVQSFPIMTTFLIALGFQIVFLYNPSAGAIATIPWICDDSDIQLLDGRERTKDEAPVVLMFGAPSRGRVLCERLEHRVKYESDSTTNKYVAPKTQVVLFNTTPVKEREFVKSNLAVRGVDNDSLYEIVIPTQVSHDNCFQLPHADNSVDKVFWSPFIRNAEPIGSMVTSEHIKAQKMSMMLDEVFRVLKPGGKFISVDTADRAILTYADLRDSVGQEHISMEENVATMRITLFMPLKLFKVVGTKPDHFIPTGRLYVTKKKEEDPSATKLKGGVNQREMERELVAGDESDRLDGAEDSRPTLSRTSIIVIMFFLQMVIFFGLAFAAAALYIPLDMPSDLPLSQRAGNVLPSICSGYASFAFFERELVLGTMRIHSVGNLLFWELKAGLVTVLISIIFTAVLTVPQMALQIGLHDVGVGDTVLSLIGIAISIIIGIVAYKVSSRSRTKATLQDRKLDYDKYKKYF